MNFSNTHNHNNNNNLIINDDKSKVNKVSANKKLYSCRHNKCTHQMESNHRVRHEKSKHEYCDNNPDYPCLACSIEFPRGRKSSNFIMMEEKMKAEIKLFFINLDLNRMSINYILLKTKLNQHPQIQLF